MLHRFDDAHQLAYHDFLLERMKQPFKWGSNDCATCAADGLLALTGKDLMADLRGTYTTATGALRAAKAATGSRDLLQAVSHIAERNGLSKRQHPLTAMRGDLVLVEQADGKLICGLVGMSGRWIHAPGETGLLSLCLTTVRHAWTY